MTTDLQHWALLEVKRFLAPLIDAAESDEFLFQLFERIGWEGNLFPETVLSRLREALREIETTSSALFAYPKTLKEVVNAVEGVRNVLSSIDGVIESFEGLALVDNPEPEELLEHLIFLLTVEYFYGNYPRLFFCMESLGLTKTEYQTGAPLRDENDNVVRVPPNILKLELGAVTELLRDPAATLKKVFLGEGGLENVAEAREFSDRIFPRIAVLLGTYGFDYRYGLPEERKKTVPVDIVDKVDRTLYLVSPRDRVRAELLVLPESEVEDGPALQVTTAGVADLQFTVGGWLFQVEANGELSSLLIRPGSIRLPGGGDAGVQVRGSASRLGDNDEPLLVLGSQEGTRFELGLFCVDAHFDSRAPDYGFGFYAVGCAFVLEASSADSFLKKALPARAIRANLNFGLSWSRLHGFRLCGNLGTEVDLPLGVFIHDLVKLESTYLGLHADTNELSISAGLSTVFAMGPITVSAQRVGLKATYGFRDSVVERFHFGFLQPEGVGLSISSSGIAGGGFLDFDKTNKRYTGALSLSFGEIGLAAIGLITTKLPDGSDGFALLVNIGVTFDPPIQLAMGFTLSGVGGLIGVNRSINIDALRTGLRNRALDSTLFPDPSTVIANVSKIISDLRTVFPPEEDRYVVGPMVKIGWGNPNIMTADLGIFLEFPDPVRIVVMGQLEASLPEKKDALVVIHLDVLGVVDFDKEELTFQASLYDSHILSYALLGDSAFILGWGREPRFALAMGGFHPKFTPPPPAIVFSDLKRLTLSISSGKRLQLVCRAYQALTPNSLQFGARVDLFASAGGLTAEGYLGFDALFCFSPFSFEVEICGGVHLSYEGWSFLKLDLTLLLSGPTPWHARGKARIKLLFVSIKVGFSFTWGEGEKATLLPIDPWVALPTGGSWRTVLQDPGNWHAVLPAQGTMVEALRGFEEEPGEIIVHPAGRLEVRQSVVPLGVRLGKFGNAPIAGHDRFDITKLSVGEDGSESDSGQGIESVEEYFARAQFEELTSDQKLSLPAFEKMKGGVITLASEALYAYGDAEAATLEYESININADGTSTRDQPSPAPLAWDEAKYFVRTSGARREVQRAGPRQRFSRRRITPKITTREERYCVASAVDLTEAELAEELRGSRDLTRMVADERLAAQRQLHPEDATRLMVIPEGEMAV